MNSRYFWCVFLLLMSFVSVVNATELTTDTAPKVTLRTWLGDTQNSLESNNHYVPSEQIILHIEISTNRWFSAGTQIGHIEINDVLVKQRSQFAINSTERKSGQTWSLQTWEVALYPQKSGHFSIEPFDVTVQIATDHGKKKSATLTSKSMSFDVALPSAELNDAKPWFAASGVTLTQEWQTSNDESLHVGDSVTRSIKIEAQDSLSILLPQVLEHQTNPAWQLYADAPILEDKQDRSGYISTRVDEQTYIIQQGGELNWPDYELLWWNTQTEQLEKVTIKGRSFTIKHTLTSWLKAHSKTLLLCIFVIISIGTSFLFIKRYYQSHPLPQWIQFYHAVFNENWPLSRAMVYSKLRHQTELLELRDYRSDQNWQTLSYELQESQPQTNRFIYIWRQLKSQAKVKLSLPKALPQLTLKKR